MRRCYLLAYDITDDARRARMATLLLDHGDRVQKSVFEAELSAAELEEILRGAAKLIHGEDSLRVYPLCASCAGEVRAVGLPGPVGGVNWRIV